MLGALLAQDLALFVVFFDLMLVPFFFLTGIWGGPGRIAAVTKLFIYTLVGSLLMLAAAIATGVLAAGDETSFVLTDLQQATLDTDTQTWIFLCFAAAFLVKMPAFPLHGWMPDGYREMPLPVLAVFSGVLSKVAAYGFLKIVLPLFPDAAADLQPLLLGIALASILYGSAMAFTTTETRLILGYSSVAQLGFIVLGVFALEQDGAQGAILQSVNHGLVVLPAFFIVGLLAARAGGSSDIRDMGGVAFRAPVLGALFLVVALATLAMPGSSNFVGEFLILLGVFRDNMVIAFVASAGVVLASVYMLRMFIRSMHNRARAGGRVARHPLRRRARARAARRDDHRAVAVPAAAAREGRERHQPVRAARPAGAGLRGGGPPMKGPTIDWAGLSPLLSVLGGSLVVLMLGLLRSRFARETLVPLLSIVALGGLAGLSVWQWDEQIDLISGAMRVDALAMYLNCLFAVAGIATVLLSWRADAPRETAHGEFYSLLLASIGGMVVLVAAQNTVTLFLGFELLSIPLYVLCAAEMRRETSLESGLKYLVIGSVGSATLVYGLALLYGATGSTDFNAMAQAIDEDGLVSDSLLLGGVALVVVGLAFKASVAPFHQWTPDVYQGAPTPVTAFMAVATKAAAFGVLLRLFDVALIDVQPTGPGPRDAGDDHDRRRQRRRDRAELAQAPARVVVGRAGGLPARRRRRRARASASRRPRSTSASTCS